MKKRNTSAKIPKEVRQELKLLRREIDGPQPHKIIIRGPIEVEVGTMINSRNKASFYGPAEIDLKKPHPEFVRLLHEYQDKIDHYVAKCKAYAKQYGEAIDPWE